MSTPMGNAFLDELDEESRRGKTVALCRLLNEYVAEICRLHPQRFSFMAVLPLPWVEEAVVEARYALGELGAVGVAVCTNHEGRYVGDEAFDPVWDYLNESGKGGREVVFVHPTEPVIRLEDGRVVNSRPCKSHSPTLYTFGPNSPSSLLRDFDIEDMVLMLKSTPPLRPRRILLRNRTRNLQHHRPVHHHKILQPPLANLPWRRCISRYLRALPARLP